MELEAIKLVRNTMNLRNLWLMVPFIRTVKELIEVKHIMSTVGLYRSPTFKLWMMVEVPSTVILLEKFIAVGIDGVSIGLNDLAMLLLGVDRENKIFVSEFDEQNPAVLWALERVITTAHKHHITSSVCGHASMFSYSLLEKLVQWGVSSVSVGPDSVSLVRKHVAEVERKLLSYHYGKN